MHGRVPGVALAELGDIRVDGAQRGGHREPRRFGVGTGTDVDRRHCCPLVVLLRFRAVWVSRGSVPAPPAGCSGCWPRPRTAAGRLLDRTLWLAGSRLAF